MPVYIYAPDAFDKLTRVEGDHWREMQDDDKFGPCSFAAFLSTWERECKPLREKYSARQLIENGMSVEGSGAIYGAGGWTRYTVRYDGEIMFIRDMSPSDEITRRAAEAGFRLFPECMPRD